MSDLLFGVSGAALWLIISWILIQAKDDNNAIISVSFFISITILLLLAKVLDC